MAAGTDVNTKSDTDWTPLHNAAGEGNKEIVERLIDKGADVNPKTNDGYTPLDWVDGTLHNDTADVLRKHGGKTGKELKAEGK